MNPRISLLALVFVFLQIVWFLPPTVAQESTKETPATDAPIWIEGSSPGKDARLCLRKNVPFLIQSKEPYVQLIDVAKKSLTVEKFSSDVKPVSLQATNQGKLFFVARGGTRNKLLVEDAKGWTAYTLPDEVKQSDLDNLRVTVDQNGMAVCLNNRLYVKVKNEWISATVPVLRQGYSPNTILFGKNDVFLGFDMDEFRGALAAFDLNKREFFITEKVLPVSDMCLDKNGTLWFTGSGSLKLNVGGSLRSFHQQKLLLHADTYGEVNDKTGMIKTKGDNWSGNPTTFTSLSFDKAGQIYIGTLDQGVYKSIGGKFVQISQPLSGAEKSKPYISEMLPYDGNLLYIVPGRGVFFQKLEAASQK